MNPGYVGRAEPPDNLKALLGPVAIMVPNYGLIEDIILYSARLNAAKLLGRKMVNFYRFSYAQRSMENHYDFGMRAVKSVFVLVSLLKRQSPDLEVDLTLIRVLRDFKTPSSSRLSCRCLRYHFGSVPRGNDP